LGNAIRALSAHGQMFVGGKGVLGIYNLKLNCAGSLEISHIAAKEFSQLAVANYSCKQCDDALPHGQMQLQLSEALIMHVQLQLHG